MLLFPFTQLLCAAPKMDTTITYDEVATLIRVNIPSLEPCPTFKKIRTLCHHFEQALQCLPCLQSTLHGWKGLIMLRKLYALLTGLNNAFRLPMDLGPNTNYTWPVAPGAVPDLTPLSRTSRQQFICALRIRSIISYRCRILNVRASPHLMQASTMLSRCLPIPQSKDGMLE